MDMDGIQESSSDSAQAASESRFKAVDLTRTGVGEDKKLYVCTPIYGNVDIHFFQSWCHLMAEGATKVPMMVDYLPGDSLVPRARNTLTRRFLESDCTHILMIDSDLVFSLQHIYRIISHDVDVVGGVYCKKQDTDEVQIVCNSLKLKNNLTTGLSEVGYVGTGFICISRKVFEKMIEQFGEEMWYMVTLTIASRNMISGIADGTFTRTDRLRAICPRTGGFARGRWIAGSRCGWTWGSS
jgi:hypothetical protein